MFVQLKPDGSLRRGLGNDRDEAKFRLLKSQYNDDYLTEIDESEYSQLCAENRYKIACIRAANPLLTLDQAAEIVEKK